MRKKNRYSIPHNVYMQMTYKIKDIKRLKLERREAEDKGEGVRLPDLKRQIDAVEESISEMENCMKEKVEAGFDGYKAYFSEAYFNMMHKRSDDDDLGPSRRTWNNYKTRLAEKIAVKLGIL